MAVVLLLGHQFMSLTKRHLVFQILVQSSEVMGLSRLPMRVDLCIFMPETKTPVIEPVIGGPAARVMSLRDGSKKMSKSDPSDLSRINMGDDADTIAQKFRKAKTDPDALPSEEAGLENRPEARNLVAIYAALEDQSVDAVLNDIGGRQFSEFKPMLIDRAVATLSPISAEMNRLMQEPDEIDRVLANGAERARKIAQPILNQTYDIMGLLRS